MKKKTILTYLLVSVFTFAFAQSKKIDHPILAVYKLLSNESLNIKDSLAIYALNFELTLTKRKGRTVVTNIAANDSLAFKLFPSYKKLSAIDFSLLMGCKNKIRLVIPILISGSSPEKQVNKDKDGNALISFNAAVNAAYALYNPAKFSNIKDKEVSLGHLLFKNEKEKTTRNQLWEAVIMEPIFFQLHNIK